jgi:hypothetical protein
MAIVFVFFLTSWLVKEQVLFFFLWLWAGDGARQGKGKGKGKGIWNFGVDIGFGDVFILLDSSDWPSGSGFCFLSLGFHSCSFFFFFFSFFFFVSLSFPTLPLSLLHIPRLLHCFIDFNLLFFPLLKWGWVWRVGRENGSGG